MVKAIKSLDPDVHFRLLHLLEEEPELTQRGLSQKLGISLGGVNYCLKALIEILKALLKKQNLLQIF